MTTVLRDHRNARRTLASPAVAVLAIAAFAAVALRPPLLVGANDTLYAIDWWRDPLANRSLPPGSLPFSIAHPLATLVAGPAALLGDVGMALLIAAGLLCLAVSLVNVARTGAEAWDLRVGVIGAVVFLTSGPFVGTGASAHTDVIATALALWALLLVVREPARGILPIALLSIAALQRPEFLGVAGAYWAYLVLRHRTRRRLVEAAVIAAALVIWVVFDATLTAGTVSQTVQSGETTRSAIGENVFQLTVRAVRGNLPDPLLAVAAVGLGLAWRARSRSTSILVGALVADLLSVLATGIAGAPVVARFAVFPSAVLALFAAYAVVRIAEAVLRASRPVRLAGAAVALLFGALLAVALEPKVRDLRSVTGGQNDGGAAFQALLDRPPSAGALRHCFPISLARTDLRLIHRTGRPYPDFRIAPSRPPFPFARGARQPTRGVLVEDLERRRLYVSANSHNRGDDVRSAGPLHRLIIPPRFRLIAQEGRFRVYAAGCAGVP